MIGYDLIPAICQNSAYWNCTNTANPIPPSIIYTGPWPTKTEVLDKTLESHLNSMDIKPVHPKRNQPWIFIGRADAEAAVPILCLSDVTAGSLEKPLMLEIIEGKRRGWQRMSWLDSITDLMDMNLASSRR